MESRQNFSTPLIRFSHDIWHQVVQYFEHKAEDDDAVENRAALLNIALTSRTLSSLALAILWANMSSLQPIVNVINFFAARPQKPILVRVEKEKGCWELSGRADKTQIISRAREYLSRIRSFHACAKDKREGALWPILIACYGGEKPLLPNLRKLEISFFDDLPTPYNLLPLILPQELQTITSRAFGSQCSGAIVTLCHLLRPGCRSLKSFKHFGHPSYIISILASFKSLEELSIFYDKTVRPTGSLALPELLRRLPSLRYLTINLDALPTSTAASRAAPPLEHCSLQVLHITGNAEELHAFFSSNILYPSMAGLMLNIRPGKGLCWKKLCDEVASNFPTLDTLDLKAFSEGTYLAMSSLNALLSLRISCLKLQVAYNGLVQEDLLVMAKAWPQLGTLVLSGFKTCFDVTTAFSNLRPLDLHTLQLPLDLTTFPSFNSFPLTQRKSLKKLGICYGARFPPTLRSKIMLARSIRVAFPGLKTVWTDRKKISAEVQDLQDILDGIRDAVAVDGKWYT